jgi:D-alanyl-D-alanine carboxypeptidase/D-alanyl-D-alanine-endopeptidase (penicillin-binding protein 4)
LRYTLVLIYFPLKPSRDACGLRFFSWIIMLFIQKMRALLLASTLASPLLPLAASAQNLPPSVETAFKSVGVPLKNVGVFVREISSDHTMIGNNLQTPFNPASVMKLITTNVALDTLGPAYTWTTTAYTDGAIKDGVLDGNLIIKGGGDPKFVMENLWLLLRQIRAKGVRMIRGNLVIDDQLFTRRQDDAFTFDDAPQKPYNANPSAFLLNFKTITFRFVADVANHRVNVTMEPAMDYPITPPALGQGPCGDWKAKLRPDIRANSAEFLGEFPAACQEQLLYIHPDTMTSLNYADKVFRQMWSDMGGMLLGKTEYGELSASAVPIAQWKSPPLVEIIRDINKYSNNVMTRQLLLTLVAHSGYQPADASMGGAVIKKWFSEQGLNGHDLVIENGSGLSRSERVTPQALGEMLTQAFQSPLMPEYISSMPLVGVDGTMKSRLKNTSVSGQAHIKTGLLNDVRAIAGYVRAASGKYYVITCMVNHPRAAESKAALDQLLQWVYQHG